MFGKSADTRYDFTNELNPSTQSDEKAGAVAATATSTAAAVGGCHSCGYQD